MLFPRASKLRITYTVADLYAADQTYEEGLVLPGIGPPRGVYHALKGSAADMTWPQGAGVFGFGGHYGFGNQLITDSFGTQGIRSWRITALPGKVPGRLTVASYHNDNYDDAAPDDIEDYDLGLAGWDTGDLPVQPTDGSTLWRYPLIRWVPINLLSLL